MWIWMDVSRPHQRKKKIKLKFHELDVPNGLILYLFVGLQSARMYISKHLRYYSQFNEYS